MGRFCSPFASDPKRQPGSQSKRPSSVHSWITGHFDGWLSRPFAWCRLPTPLPSPPGLPLGGLRVCERNSPSKESGFGNWGSASSDNKQGVQRPPTRLQLYVTNAVYVARAIAVSFCNMRQFLLPPVLTPPSRAPSTFPPQGQNNFYDLHHNVNAFRLVRPFPFPRSPLPGATPSVPPVTPLTSLALTMS